MRRTLPSIMRVWRDSRRSSRAEDVSTVYTVTCTGIVSRNINIMKDTHPYTKASRVTGQGRNFSVLISIRVCSPTAMFNGLFPQAKQLQLSASEAVSQLQRCIAFSRGQNNTGNVHFALNIKHTPSPPDLATAPTRWGQNRRIVLASVCSRSPRADLG